MEERHITIDEVMAAGKDGSLTECFGTGTAAVVIHVNEVGYQGDTITLDANKFKVAPFAKGYIESLRDGSIEDKFDWTVKLEQQVKA